MIKLIKNNIVCTQDFTIENLPPKNYNANIGKNKHGGESISSSLNNSWISNSSIVKNSKLHETLVQSNSFIFQSKLEFNNINMSKLLFSELEHVFSNYNLLAHSIVNDSNIEYSNISNCTIFDSNIEFSKLFYVVILNLELSRIKIKNCNLTNCTISGYGTLENVSAENKIITIQENKYHC